MAIKTIFFDLDDTLYPSASGIWPMIGQRINAYMLERLNIDPEVVPSLRHQLYDTYGTTMRGLQATYGIDMDDYLDFVHDVPVEEILHQDPGLRTQLLSYPQRKIIFTNADTKHAERVIRALNIQDCFEQIIDIQQIAPACKPQPEAYRKALQIAGETDPSQCLVVDDSVSNLLTAHSLGFYTVLIGHHSPNQGCDASIPNLTELTQVLTWLKHKVEDR